MPYYGDYGEEGYGGREWEGYKKNKGDTYLYNGCTGLEVLLPQGYYTTGYNETNLTPTPRESAYFETMDLYDYMDGGYGLDLAGVQNTPAGEDADLGQLQLFMEYYPDIYEFDGYVRQFMDYMQGDAEEYSYTLRDSGEAEINGGIYVMLSYEINYAGEYYIDEYYLAPAGNETKGLFFVANIFYSPYSAKSREDAYFFLENCFSFSQNPSYGRPEARMI